MGPGPSPPLQASILHHGREADRGDGSSGGTAHQAANRCTNKAAPYSSSGRPLEKAGLLAHSASPAEVEVGRCRTATLSITTGEQVAETVEAEGCPEDPENMGEETTATATALATRSGLTKENSGLGIHSNQ